MFHIRKHKQNSLAEALMYSHFTYWVLQFRFPNADMCLCNISCMCFQTASQVKTWLHFCFYSQCVYFTPGHAVSKAHYEKIFWLLFIWESKKVQEPFTSIYLSNLTIFTMLDTYIYIGNGIGKSLEAVVQFYLPETRVQCVLLWLTLTKILTVYFWPGHTGLSCSRK